MADTTYYDLPYPASTGKVSLGYKNIQDLAEQVDAILYTAGLPIVGSNVTALRTDTTFGGSVSGTYSALTITNNAITTAKILNDAVTTAKILDANVTGAKIESSVALAGSPTTTTQSSNDDSAKIATTEFVQDVAQDFVLGILPADSITNVKINSAAAIAYSKLNLVGSILNADVSSSAAIAYSKLALTGAILNADLAGSIAYSKLSLATSIVNGDISATAAIVDTKLATISTASKVSNSATTATDANTASAIVARDASGNFTAGTITAALTGNASTATSATTSTNIAGGAGGSVPYQSSANTTALLANGASGQVLTSAGTTLAPTWTTPVGAAHAANHISGGSDPVIGDSISSAGSYTSWTATSATIGGQLSGINSALAMTLNAQTASYTLVLTDRNKLVEISNASANNLTVPLNSSVAYPVGSQITILQTGAGQTTIVATGGVTINATPGLKLRTQWSSATLVKRATDTWVAIGDLTA